MNRTTMSLIRWSMVVLTSSVLLLGCAYGNAMKAGERAMEGQQFDEAVASFERAVQLEPGKEEAKAKLAQARGQAVARRTQNASERLASGDLPGAAKLLGEAAALLPGEPSISALAEQVATATIADGQKRVTGKQFATALDLYQAVLMGMPLERPRLETAVAAAGAAWVAHLGAGADAAEGAGRKADALLHREMISRLTGVKEGRCTALRKALREKHQFVVAQKANGSTVASQLTGAPPEVWIQVLAPGQAPIGARATLEFSLGRPRLSTTQSRRSASAEYLSGTRQTVNPFYETAQRSVYDAERRVLDREREVSRQESYVDRYSQDVAREGSTPNTTTGAEQNLYNARNQLESARRSLDDERSSLQRTRDELARTNQFREEPVYSTATYTVTRHTLRATAALTGKLTPTLGAPVVITRDLAMEQSDEEHPAVPIADIPADPLQLPSAEEVAAQFEREARADLEARIYAMFTDYRRTIRASAEGSSDEGAKVEQLVLYVLLDPQSGDPEVSAKLYQLRGIPDAPRLLSPGGSSGGR